MLLHYSTQINQTSVEFAPYECNRNKTLNHLNSSNHTLLLSDLRGRETWPPSYKSFFMINSAEHEIYPAHKF